MEKTTSRKRALNAPSTPLLARPPGEEAHICQGLVRRDHDRLELVAVVLPWSGALWAEFVVHSNKAEGVELCKVLEHAWEFFGGVPRTWVFETMSRLPSEVLELAQRLGSTATIELSRPNKLGWGELALRRVPEWLLSPEALRDLTAANRVLRIFVAEWTKMRPHPRHRDRSIGKMLKEERLHLCSEGDDAFAKA